MENWPNFFIIGAPRSGTTSLYEYLKDVPGVYLSPVKEPQYFAPNYPKNDSLKPTLDKKQYLALFENVKDKKAIGEASTSYLWDPDSPRKIYETIPKARLIVILRNPINRAFSHYLTGVRSNYEKQSFYDALEKIITNFEPLTSKRYLHAGLYAKQIKRYLDIFGRKQFKIIIFEEFIKDPKGTINEVLKFLNLHYQITEFNASIHNTYKLPRGKIESVLLNNELIRQISQKIFSKNIRAKLRDKILLTEDKPRISTRENEILYKFYSDDVSELKKILGRKLPWPTFNG